MHTMTHITTWTLRGLGFAAISLCATLLSGTLAPASESDERRLTLGYYLQLAESGSADAQLTLGDLYSNGDGVEQDLIEAYAWYYLAAQQGVEEAVRPMNAVLRALPEHQWAEAKHKAEDYERRFLSAARQ